MSAHEIQEGNEADEIQDSYDTEPQYTNNGFLEEVVEAIEDDFWSANIHVNSNETTFKLDTRSKIYVVGSSTPWTKRVKLMPTDSQFKGPGGVKLDHLIIGVTPQANLTIDNRVHRENVYIMKNQNKNLLSKTAIQALQLLKTTSSIYAVELATNFRNEFPALFKGLGLLQEPYRIRLRQHATPVCLYTPRRVPHPLLPKVKEQLQTMI